MFYNTIYIPKQIKMNDVYKANKFGSFAIYSSPLLFHYDDDDDDDYSL